MWTWLGLVACGFGLSDDQANPCYSGEKNCCTGSLALTGPAEDTLQVVAAMSCPTEVATWTLSLDGTSVADGVGDGPNAAATVDLDLADLGLGNGAHSVTLEVSSSVAGDAAVVADAGFDYDGAPVDTGETGDTDDSGDSGGLAELQPADVIATPEVVGRLEDFTLGYTVYSYGTVDAGASTVAIYWSTDLVPDGDDIRLTTMDLDAIATGARTTESVELQVPDAAATGESYVLVVVDADEEVAESDETNNVWYTPITVSGPDVALTTGSLDMTSGGADVDVVVRWTAWNVGGADADAHVTGIFWSSDAIFDASDTLLTTAASPALAPDEAASGSATAHLPSGIDDGWVLVIADPDAEIEDADRTNNGVAIGYAVLSTDLDVLITGVSPESGSAGDTVSVGIAVQNSGTDRADAFDIAVYQSADATWDVGDTRLTGASASYLEAGTSTAVTLPATLPSTLDFGDTWLLVVVDEGGAIDETDETDNVAATAFTISGPNLVPTISGLGTSTPYRGSNDRVYWSVANTGNATSGTATAGFYLSADSAWDSGDTLLTTTSIAAIAAGGDSGTTETIVTIPSSIATGPWTILLAVDIDGSVVEDDESDNVTGTSITVN